MDSDRVLEQIRATGLVPADAPIGVLLSGGPDFVFLPDVAVRPARPARVVALHVNYGLRPEAPGDERHCAALCARLGVPLEVERPRRESGAGNVQAWARDVRLAAA